MDFNHIAFDGTSLAIICDEIAKAYEGIELEAETIGQFGLSVYEENYAKAYNN